MFQSHHQFGRSVSDLLRKCNGHVPPPGDGYDAGDHPPITPMRIPHNGELHGKQQRLYEYVAKHFIASLHEDVAYTEFKAVAEIDDGRSTARYEALFHQVRDRGFLYCMPFKGSFLKEPRGQTDFAVGMRLQNVRVTRSEGWTEPPAYLTEGELVDLMDKHGIGTDASTCSRRLLFGCIMIYVTSSHTHTIHQISHGVWVNLATIPSTRLCADQLNGVVRKRCVLHQTASGLLRKSAWRVQSRKGCHRTKTLTDTSLRSPFLRANGLTSVSKIWCGSGQSAQRFFYEA